MKEETIKVLSVIYTNPDYDIELKRGVERILSYPDEVGKISEDDLFGDSTSSIPITNFKNLSENPRDYRVVYATFGDFRSIPFSGENEKPFGIDFTQDGESPCSLFLVGRNGTSKTSVFSGLEYAYSARNGLSRTIAAGDNRLLAKKILTYGFQQLADNTARVPKITLKTVSGGVVNLDLDTMNSYCSPASFCSEYDLQQLCLSGNSLYHYLMEQIGYDEIYELLARLEELIALEEKKSTDNTVDIVLDFDLADIKELITAFLKIRANGVEQLGLESEWYEKALEEYNQNGIPDLFSSYWNKLGNAHKMNKNDELNLVEQYLQNENSLQLNTIDESVIQNKIQRLYQRIAELWKKYNTAKDPYLAEEEILEDLFKTKIAKESMPSKQSEEQRKEAKRRFEILRSLRNAIENECDKIRVDFVENRFPAVNSIMRLFDNYEDDLVFSVNERNSLAVEVSHKEGDGVYYRATPQEFYNSFRFKLYAVSFKIAIAFLEMKLRNIRIPIVIDDVFSASDFENNLRLELFVYNIYEAYEELGFKEQLQLILLSHDELVQTAFKKGANLVLESIKKGKDHQKHLKHDYVCGRLFSYKFAKKMEQDLRTIDKKETQRPFYNLYMKM